MESSAGAPALTLRQALKAVAIKLFPAGKALARQGQFVLARGMPGGLAAVPGQADLPHVRRGRAQLAQTVARLGAKSFKESASAALPLWRELGPRLIPKGQTYGKGPGARPSVSGRCCGLVVDRSDPRRLVLCSAGGGLWGSEDLGVSWQPLTDTQPTLVMGAVAQAPSSPGVMYAATGDGDGGIPYGIGLIRSSDGGKSWTTNPASQLQGTAAYDLAVDPSDPLRVWIATNRGLFVSSNGGDTASRELVGECWSVSIHPDSGEILAGTSGGIQRRDASGVWSVVPLPKMGGAIVRLEAAHAVGDKGVAYVAGCIVERSPADPNAPKTWAMVWRRATPSGPFNALNVPAQIDTSQGWYDWCLAISPVDSSLVLFGAIELFRGRYSGGKMTWTNVSSQSSGDSIHPDQHYACFDRVDANVVYACSDGGLFRSPDLGKSWKSLNPGLGITEFEYLAQLPSDPDWLLGGTQDNGTLLFAGSRRWDQVALGDGGDCAAVDRGKNSICYHSYYGMDIEKAAATNGSFAWKDVSPPAGSGYRALFYPPLDARDTSLVKAGESVWVSEDEGKTWQEVLLPQIGHGEVDRASAIAIPADGLVFVGTISGRLWRVKRGTQGWSGAVVTQLAQLGGYVSDLSIRVGPKPFIWATCSTVGSAHVFASTNNGQFFEDRTSDFPDIPANCVAVDPDNPATVYVGSDRGVFRSIDNGKHWREFNNGLPNVIVGTMQLNLADRLLRIGTRSRGAWEAAI